jgi:endonuclease-8
MPEGPSIVILKEKVRHFAGHCIVSAHGNAKIDMERLQGQTVRGFKSWGKHFLICFDAFFIRIHLLMFGTYRIDERKENPLRLALEFDNGELNFYTAQVRLIDGNPNDFYDWAADVMNPEWSARKAMKKIKANPVMACDALMDQEIFSGVGNIIKNEVLYRCRIHPESATDKIPVQKLRELIREARHYSFEFLEWKLAFTLKKHWLAYNKKCCPRCDLLIQRKVTGTRQRRSFFCTNCQKLYV